MTFESFIKPYVYLGQCNMLRKCGNELLWKKMINSSQEVSKEELLDNVDMSPLLDKDETEEQFLDELSDVTFWKSMWGNKSSYYIQTRGFEFIFIEK